MINRIDKIVENPINPITGIKYDESWTILILTDSTEYQQMCGSHNGCAYTIKLSRHYDRWQMAVGDFIGFNGANGRNMILVMSETDLANAKNCYAAHRFNEPVLREYEPDVLIHSTTMESWNKIQRDGMLKSWNRLKRENAVNENSPIGSQLGDPADFSDYIMFGGGVTGEIVVNSKQSGKIIMDIDGEYQTGARLYFDAKKIARDGLLVRDGTHVKVKESLPLEPYLIWVATWRELGLPGQISTPRIFAEAADRRFSKQNEKN